MATADAYMPGLVNLGDVLVSKGYVQEFLCGSDGSFAGRDKYFRQHGNYRICDIYAAREKGYVPEDYWHSWGLEDNVLFDIARKELTNLASEGKPFNFTMLTVDLHTPDGYLCEWCGDSYASVTGNVIDCNDRVITEFVRWCQAQDFYQDTVIIITGDHPRMDASLVDGVAYYDRTVYDCFLNSAVESKQDAKTRTFTTVDMFPTILAAMGFDIEGNRLGLGTNVFSEQKTLAEEHGFEWLNQEVAKSSNYYVTKFAPNLNLEDLN
jgi:phosphoglycerol transferase